MHIHTCVDVMQTELGLLLKTPLSGGTEGHGYVIFTHILMVECEHPLKPKGVMEW